MLRRAACLLMLLMMCAVATNAQRAPNDGTRQPRILLLVDASSSMLQPWGNNTIRFKAAGKIIEALMDSIYAVNAGVEFGLRVYGHQSPAQNNDCFDSRQEVMFSKNNFTQMGLRLASIRPFGVSPIAYSLSEAANNDLVDEVHNAYSVILITDGGESCGGNICEVVKTLISRKIYFKPYILSLVNYAPLKEQYACLGTYLQIARESDMAPAISTIVEAYRPMLSAPIMVVKTEPVPEKPKTVVPDIPKKTEPVPEKPKMIVVDVPKWIPDHSSVTTLPVTIPKSTDLATNHSAPVPGHVQIKGNAQVTKAPKEQQDIPTGLTPSRGDIPGQKTSFSTPAPGTKPVPGIAIVTKTPKEQQDLPVRIISAPNSATRTEGSEPVAIKNNTSAPPTATVKKDSVQHITQPVRTGGEKTTVVITPLAPVKTSVKTTPLARPAVNNKPKELPFTTKTEDAKETSLSILFTDGHGKFYASTPQLQLMDAATGKLVKQFHRTVDATGNPDPQIIPAGVYNMLVVGRANMLMRRIVVEANKKNIIVIQVSNGSLRFRYEDAPERPVEEFDAIVNIRFEPGPTVKQRCTSELDYPPGNYFIEINTLPLSRFNTDIDFGSTTEIQIPQSGFVQFTNTTPVGTVALYTPLGNKFVRFHGLVINGNPEDQRLRLRPGAYEVHWFKNPNAPLATETIDRFVVKGNSVTSVELH